MNQKIQLAMAGIVTATQSFITAPPRLLCRRQPQIIKHNLFSFLSFSKMGFDSLQKSFNFPVRKLVIRAARAESKGVSLGFRAPHFEVRFDFIFNFLVECNLYSSGFLLILLHIFQILCIICSNKTN